MNDALLAEVDRRLTAQVVTPQVADLVLSACLSPDELDEGAPAPSRPEPVGHTGIGEARAGVFLASVTVEGFRGIEPALTLPLRPGPGPCLIVAGSSARWASKKSKAWQEGWRNLHHRDWTEVQGKLVVEGRPGYTTVTRKWAAGADLASGTVTVTRPGEQTVDFASLGWRDALLSYRPFLSYSELGGLLEDGPSKLFDALNAILGLEDLTGAAKALAGTRPGLERRAKQTAAERQRVADLLRDSQDKRSDQLLAAVTAKVPNLDAIGDLIEPTLLPPPPGGALSGWRAWAEAPDSAVALADHLTTIARWRDDVLVVRAEAEGQLAALVDQWRPIAQAGMAWLDHARADRADATKVKNLKAAEAWLKKPGEVIRAERFARLAEAATTVWEEAPSARQRQHRRHLPGWRQQQPPGQGRHVGRWLRWRRPGGHEPGRAARPGPGPVLSPGHAGREPVPLHRHRRPGPGAKVEGLARVLERTATTHQVVVLTHDERRPEAVRRLRIASTIIEVYRGHGSKVVVAKVFDPVDRHLRYASDVAVTADLPDEVKGRVVPTLRRQALEATCIEIVRRRRLSRGDRHEDVEEVIALANQLNKSFALAMFDDMGKGGDVVPKLRDWDRRMEHTYQAATTAPTAAIPATRKTWVSLSGACHVRAYDLAPSPDELSRWLTDTSAVIAGLAAAA